MSDSQGMQILCACIVCLFLHLMYFVLKLVCCMNFIMETETELCKEQQLYWHRANDNHT